MELATQALGSLLPKLGTLLSDGYNLQRGVRGEIKFLQGEMEIIQAVLYTLSELPAHQIPNVDKIWLRDLKELSYDIEDSVDTFMVRIDTPVSDKPRSFKRFFDKTIGLLTKAKIRHRVANDIEDIKKRIREFAEKRARYNFEGVAARLPDTATVDPRVLASFEYAANLVGTDVPVEKVSSFLTNKGKGVGKQKKRMVVSIVGVGGLGKTTIANLVYERLRGQFDCQAFTSVSLRPNMKQILGSILRQVSKDECTNAGEKEAEELIRSIRQFLEGKRYFIVIDDVWSEEAWKTIEASLIDNNLGSRVIVTTRNVEVANLSSSDAEAMYELDPLSYEDSKKLLSKRIFNEEEGILSELEEVTKKILKKCGGIPLAIITIASMLASMPNKTNLERYDVYKSMDSGLERDKSFENMREILYLSYGDLPSYLKPCLLYLSMFPEDYEIPRETLIRLWVAEGFVDDGERGSNLYELAERYFNELVNRSMIQPVDIVKASGIARACRVHDMILDLIISLSTQENFATISGGPSTAGKIRRLSLQGNGVSSDVGDSVEEKVIRPTTTNISQVRTLIALDVALDDDEWMSSLSKLSMFSILRVLVLELYYKMNNNYFKGLGSLHHLRYLELRGPDIVTEDLEEIGNLKHLKTLDLSGTWIGELPASIVQLRQLERLITNDKMRFPDGIEDLVSLQQLKVLGAARSPHTLAELGNLTRLRELDVTQLTESCVKTFLRSLSNLHNIHILNIDCRYFLDSIPDQWTGPARLQRFAGRLLKLPQWFSSLSKLSCLSIEVDMLGQDDIQLLGALPVLRSLDLRLEYFGAIEEQLVIGTDQPFRALTYFTFEHYERCWLVFTRGVMPKLQRLRLHFEARKRAGGGFDVGLENLTSLKEVWVQVYCVGARLTEVEDAEAKCRDTIHMHSNNPTLEMSRLHEDKIRMKKDVPGALEHLQGKVVRLLYTKSGIALLSLGSNAVHKLWRWKKSERNPYGKPTASIAPQLWQPRLNGILMTNDTNDSNPEEATACIALSKNDSYVISASGSKVSLFNMMTFKVMTTFMSPPPAATFLAFYPRDNNIIAIGMEDSTIQIYDFRIDDIKSTLEGHYKKITGLAFSEQMNVLVSSGADARLCVWSIDGWEEKKSRYIQPPANRSGTLVGDTRVQFHNDQKHLLVVHESQLAIYDGNLECLCSWSPRDALPAPISSAIYSCDGLWIYAAFCDGAIGVFEAESLRWRCRIAPSAYIPPSILSCAGRVYPTVIAAHPIDPNQIALGMSDGKVHVVGPLDADPK